MVTFVQINLKIKLTNQANKLILHARLYYSNYYL